MAGIRLIFTLLFLLNAFVAEASNPISFWGKQMLNAKSEKDRIAAQEKLASAIDSVLNMHEGWEARLDTIRSISAIKPEDEAFWILTWNVPFDDGTYTFYGRIRLPNKGKLTGHTFTLIDQSSVIARPGTKTLRADEWFGALYYKVIKTRHKKNTFYTLLGWDGNTAFSNKKLIDVLSFQQDGSIRFGAPIFDDGKRVRHRVFFEHAEKASMSLRYQEKTGLIIFDHLAPSQPSLEGQYEFYSPDFTTDAFRFEKGKWIFIANHEARNEQDGNVKPGKIERGLQPPKD